MKRAMAVLVPVILLGAQGLVTAQVPGCPPNGNGGGTNNINNNVVNTVNDQFQTANAVGGGDADSYSNSSAQGGAATVEVGDTVNWNHSESYVGDQVNWSDNDTVSSVNIETTSISNYKGRVAPLGTYPPYLPMWNHGGWGTVQAYFPNGPTTYDTVYEKTFDPANPDDMHELKGVLASLSYEGPLHFLGGMLNGVRVLLGGPDQFHRGRGFEIANSVVRDRRPEGKPLLASLVPIAILACWCWPRIAYVPLSSKETVQVSAYFPVSEIGRLVHIIPQEGIEVDGRWIQAVERDVDETGKEIDNGVASWNLRCQERDGEYSLQIRCNGKTFEKSLVVDGRKYAAPVKFYDDDAILCSEIDMADREYKPFTVIPGVSSLAMPPWVVGYLLIVLPLSFLLKPVLRIH